MPGFSDHIVYVDESGDHSLVSIDPQFPVFCLAFCLFAKETYSTSVMAALKRFKFQHFGHDMTILHEREIRQQTGAFSFLSNREKRERFLAELTQVIRDAPFTLIAVAIEKNRLNNRYKYPDNPYTIALRFGLERIYRYLQARQQVDLITHVVVESRGKKEDAQLELEFRRVCDGDNFQGRELPFQIVFASKQVNSAGLQLADLAARPISRYVLDRTQVNRAVTVLLEKLDRNERGQVDGCGLKIFP